MAAMTTTTLLSSSSCAVTSLFSPVSERGVTFNWRSITSVALYGSSMRGSQQTLQNVRPRWRVAQQVQGRSSGRSQIFYEPTVDKSTGGGTAEPKIDKPPTGKGMLTEDPTKVSLFQAAQWIQCKLQLIGSQHEGQLPQINGMISSLSALLGLSAVICYPGPAYASENRTLNPVYGDVGVFLEVGVQLIYLGALLTLLGVGSYLVVRQVLIKRELETAAKELQDRVRSGEASSLEYFELGAVMLRKKFYQVARKYLTEAIKKWDGSEQDLAQVYNALGFSYFSDSKVEMAISQYEKAVQLQPTYVTAWNNLADAYETQKNYIKALQAYEEALQFDPSNKVATAKREQMKQRVERFQGIP